jgi:hypothetical protein
LGLSILNLEKGNKISFNKAVAMIKKSEGFKTDLDKKNTFSPGWLDLDKKAVKIRFRHYRGRDGFTWSGWYYIKK